MQTKANHTSIGIDIKSIKNQIGWPISDLLDQLVLFGYLKNEHDTLSVAIHLDRVCFSNTVCSRSEWARPTTPIARRAAVTGTPIRTHKYKA